MNTFSTMHFARQFSAAVLVLAGILLLSACDSNGTNSGDPVSGFYETTELIGRSDTGLVDGLQKGVYVEMRLRSDNTVEEGVLKIPAEFTEDDVEGGRRIEFSGTWSRSRDTVTFDHEADTFIRDTKWHYCEGVLRANNRNVTAVLKRQKDAN